jgi:hypothetical protein
MYEAAGVILAGGKSRRMGSDKAFMEVGQAGMIQLVATELKKVFKEILIAGGGEETGRRLGLTVVADLIPGGGRIAEDAPAYRKIIVEPRIVGDLNHAGATLDTVAGQISVLWRRSRTDRTLDLDLTIPLGSTASIRLPDFNWREVRVSDGGQEISVRREQGLVHWETGSGRYSFRMEGER